MRAQTRATARRWWRSARTGPGSPALDRAARAGVPAFVHRVADYPDRADWDRALTASCADAQPT